MKLCKIIALLPPLLLAIGCQPLYVKTEQCEKSIKAYNRMVRWHEFDSAEKAVEPSQLAEFRRRLTGKDMHIADYRITSLSCHAEKGEAEAILEYDYYLPPSNVLKTLGDVQKWRYDSGGVTPGWRVITPPPEFVK